MSENFEEFINKLKLRHPQWFLEPNEQSVASNEKFVLDLKSKAANDDLFDAIEPE